MFLAFSCVALLGGDSSPAAVCCAVASTELFGILRQMTTPKISVIIPTYNRVAMIGRAVRSALKQIREGDEIIVVNDGSTDGTQQALAELRDCITYGTVPNGGAGKARACCKTTFNLLKKKVVAYA